MSMAFPPPLPPPAAVDEAQYQLIHDAAATGQLPQQPTTIAAPADHQLSRRSKAQSGTLAKIDSAYASVHALEVVSTLLRDVSSYLEVVSREDAGEATAATKKRRSGGQKESSQLRLPCECLRVAIDGLDSHRSILAVAIENSSDMKEVRAAHKKLMKRETKGCYPRLYPMNAAALHRGGALEESLKFASDALDDILSKTNPDFIIPEVRTKAQKRKRSALERSDETTEVGEGGAAKKPKPSGITEGGRDAEIEVIDLPALMEGQTMYSPMEAVAYISNIIANNPGRAYVRAYKDKMVAQKLVPVKTNQLNGTVAQYSGDGKRLAPLVWRNRGAKETGWDALLRQFQERQNRGLPWSIDDTRNALCAAAKDLERKPPHVEDVEARHKTLMQMHQRQNHIDAQILLQEQRLRDAPPVIPKRTREESKGPRRTKPLRFDRNDKKYQGIELPKPAGGNRIYTPAEMISNITTFMRSKPEPNKSEVRNFKEKMIAEGLVPISITQVNSIMARYSGPGKGPAPERWNSKGNVEITSIDELVEKVLASPSDWTIEETRQAVWAAKIAIEGKRKRKRKDQAEVKAPSHKTVSAYHTALLSIPEIAHRVIKPVHVRRKPGPKPKEKMHNPNPQQMYIAHEEQHMLES